MMVGQHVIAVSLRPAEINAAGGSGSLLEPAGVTAGLLRDLRSAVQAAAASEPTANGKERSTGVPR